MYLTAKQLAKKWGITERRIIKLCNENRIIGAKKNGMVWEIPEETIKPADKRNKISKYINTEKRILIVNIEEKLSQYIIPLLKENGYIVEGIYKNDIATNLEYLKNIPLIKLDKEIEKTINKTNKYYDGIIIINLEETFLNKNIEKEIINKIALKMNSEGNILKIETESTSSIENYLLDEIKTKIGIRINSLKVQMPNSKKYIIDYKNLANEAVLLITKFKNINNTIIETNPTIIEFNNLGKSKLLNNGEYYKLLNYYYSTLTSENYLWLISPMMEDEWTESPLEMNFRIINLEALNRGAKIERIFLFKKDKLEKYKDNNTINIFMQSSMNTLYADYDEILKNEPELIDLVGSGIGRN